MQAGENTKRGKMMDVRIKDKIKDIVGEDNFTDELIDLVSFSYDASEHSHRPLCAVWPLNRDQVSQLLILANEEKIPVIPRGAGTGLSGMVVPVKGGIVLDLTRMNRIIEISIENRYVVVEPGVVYADLDKALMPHGFFFPPDPASGKACTIGGNISTNAGGIRGAKYGTTRDYVLALEVILPDGRIMKTGSKAIKSVSGYDLTRLFVGSEGTLGIVTEITLKISPRPTSKSTALATFRDLEGAGKAVRDIIKGGIIPSALEILGKHTLIAINQNTNLNLPEVDALIIAETDGFTPEETEHQMEKVIRIFRENNALEIKKARNQEEVEQLWAARKSAYGVLARIKTNSVLEDVTVPINRVSELLRGIEEISVKRGIQIATFGHAGDGNLHPQILYDASDKEEVKKREQASEDLFRLAISLGGTLTGEHGIGLSKAPFMSLEHDDVSMEIMRKIKSLFDPNNILNPGKMGLKI
jgi:glycolate oxidase